MNNPSDTSLISAHDQRIKDIEHLKLLSIFNYVMGGLTALGSCIAILHIILGVTMAVGLTAASSAGEAWIGWIMAGIGLLVVLTGWTLGGLMIYSGKLIARRQKRVFSIVMAALQCLSFPVGTALGVWSIIVLSRQSVKGLYDGTDPAIANPFSSTPHGVSSAQVNPQVNPHIPDEGESEVWKNLDKLAAEEKKDPGST